MYRFAGEEKMSGDSLYTPIVESAHASHLVQWPELWSEIRSSSCSKSCTAGTVFFAIVPSLAWNTN